MLSFRTVCFQHLLRGYRFAISLFCILFNSNLLAVTPPNSPTSRGADADQIGDFTISDEDGRNSQGEDDTLPEPRGCLAGQDTGPIHEVTDTRTGRPPLSRSPAMIFSLPALTPGRSGVAELACSAPSLPSHAFSGGIPGLAVSTAHLSSPPPPVPPVLLSPLLLSPPQLLATSVSAPLRSRSRRDAGPEPINPAIFPPIGTRTARPIANTELERRDKKKKKKKKVRIQEDQTASRRHKDHDTDRKDGGGGAGRSLSTGPWSQTFRSGS